LGKRRLAVIVALSGSLIAAGPQAPAAASILNPVVTGTGLTEGQLLGIHTTIFPTFTDRASVDRVDVLVDGELATSISQLYNLNPDAGITVPMPAGRDGDEADLTVRAYDEFVGTTEATTRVRIDTIAPVLDDFTPAAGAAVPATVTLTPAGLSADVAEVAILEGKYPVSWPARKATAAPWTVVWDNQQTTDKTATVTLRVTDRAQNYTDYARTYTLKNRAPSIYLDFPARAGAGAGLLQARVFGNNGEAVAIEWWIDGAVRSTETAFYYNFGSRSRVVPVELRARDTFGNAATARLDVDVDAAGPTLTWLSPANGAYVRSKRFTSRITVADSSNEVGGYLRGGSPVRMVNGATVESIMVAPEGRKELSWEVWDAWGNMTISRRTVTVDVTAPTLKITKAPKNNAKVKGTVKITASASDRFGVGRVQLLVNGKVVATDTTAGYAFSINPKKYGKKFKIQLRAYDRAGNVTVTSTRTLRR
jgi:archaellum component FlaF (FlaF/FlaG flagellin family)